MGILSLCPPSSPALGLCWARIINRMQVMCVVVVRLTSAPSCCSTQHHCLLTPQVLGGKAGVKVWSCGTSRGNRPWPNCLFFVSGSYWQLPLSQPSWLRQNEPGPANCNGLFIISNQRLSYKPGEAASSRTISEVL